MALKCHSLSSNPPPVPPPPPLSLFLSLRPFFQVARYSDSISYLPRSLLPLVPYAEGLAEQHDGYHEDTDNHLRVIEA